MTREHSDDDSILFRKVELWVVLLIIMLGLVLLILYGASVRSVMKGRDTTGVAGEAAYALAKIPADLKQLLIGETPDYITRNMSIRARDPAAYTQIVDASEAIKRPPEAWVANPDADHQPVAMMFRTDEEGSEYLFILDSARRVVNHFKVTAESLSGRYPALVGNSSPRLVDDGTYIIHPHGSDGLYRKDVCGNTLWTVPGIFHHSFSIANGKLAILGLAKGEVTDEDQATWASNENINIIDIETGKVERSVSIVDIVRANIREADPLLFRLWSGRIQDDGTLSKDSVHLNKIEVLPDQIADQYPGLPRRAWMLSSRRVNMVFIVHPETLKFLWIAQGNTQGQHDPDFVGDNRIVVFSNNLDHNLAEPENPANFSSIKGYDFDSGQWSELYNGAEIKAYTEHSGEVDTSPDGSLMLTVTVQGRFTEVTPEGKLISEFVNVRDKNSVYWTKSAQYLTPRQFNAVRDLSCQSK